ncbi:MAG TPA: cytochrome c3 family protein [Bacteroidota bacterium]
MNTSDGHIERSTSRFYFTAAFLMLLVLSFTVITNSREVPIALQQGGIKFQHQTHVEGAGIQCIECHEGAVQSTASSDLLLSKKANCQSCHEEQLNENCTYCHTSDDPETYLPLTTPERELIFSHENHAETRQIACETCHTDLDASKEFVGALVPAMVTCNTCHNDVTASNTCESCHTNLVSLRPENHDRTDFMREHKRFARMAETSCASCHTQETCNDCHIGAGLTKVDEAGRDLTSPRSPRLQSLDRGRSNVLSTVHDLNFKFTHSISAKGKSADCQTCHRQEQFCATCHAAGGNVNQLGFKPATHSEAGFVTIGVGSGGGKHAQMARRDLESCASCHGGEAVDPTCMTCHVDTDGIRGTDPKTHTRGYMSGVNGAWHSDPGSTCFACHTDPNARTGGVKGKGFCSYCHN